MILVKLFGHCWYPLNKIRIYDECKCTTGKYFTATILRCYQRKNICAPLTMQDAIQKIWENSIAILDSTYSLYMNYMNYHSLLRRIRMFWTRLSIDCLVWPKTNQKHSGNAFGLRVYWVSKDEPNAHASYLKLPMRKPKFSRKTWSTTRPLTFRLLALSENQHTWYWPYTIKDSLSSANDYYFRDENIRWWFSYLFNHQYAYFLDNFEATDNLVWRFDLGHTGRVP